MAGFRRGRRTRAKTKLDVYGVLLWRATNAKTIAAALILSTNIMRKNTVYNALCMMHCV